MLYRTNAQSRVFEEALLAEGIPYRVVGGVGFYARTEIKDIVAYLRYIVNSSDALAFKRIVNVPRRGIGQQTLAALVQAANAARISVGEAIFNSDLLRSAVPKKLKELERFAELIADFRTTAENGVVADLLVAVMEDSGYVRELQAEDTHEARARLENLSRARRRCPRIRDQRRRSVAGGFPREHRTGERSRFTRRRCVVRHAHDAAQR